MLVDLVILTLAIASVMYSYDNSRLFTSVYKYTNQVPFPVLVFFVSALFTSLYMYFPVLSFLFMALAVSYIVVLFVMLINYILERK